VPHPRYDVAIVGAGPTGLTVANFLGQAGRQVVVIERHETTVREPRAVSIDDESLRAMQAIGLADAVIADCALDYGSHYFTPSGVCFARVEPKTREYGFPRRNAFTQPRLEATLLAGLDRFPNVTVRFLHECEDLEEVEGMVRVVARGPDGERVTIEAGYLVGCDGARSMIRRKIGATLSGATYEQPWLIVDLAATRERMRQTRVMCDPRRPFITLPGPNGIRRYEFMLRQGETEAQATDPDFVRALLAASGPDADAPIVRRQVYTFHARIADVWRRGRVVLAGDAAHLSPPFAGQGMNSGVRDAHNIAWKLAEVVSGRLGAGLLDSYQAERAPHASALIDLAIKMGKIMMPRSRAQAALVQSAFRLMRYAPRLRAYFAEMKYKPKPFYKDGFAVGATSGAQLAGRMLPQPQVERTDRSRAMLDNMLGSGFALIAYGEDAQAALERAGQIDLGLKLSAQIAILPQFLNPDWSGPRLDDAVRDTTGALSYLDLAGRTLILLLRPDRYICAAARLDELPELQRSIQALIRGCDQTALVRPAARTAASVAQD
jgi:3-(3-hydroxy-phenyl)propionate hydroxylase